MKILAISLLVLVLLQVEFVIRLDFCVDVLAKTAGFCVRVFGLKVVCGGVSFCKETKKFVLSVGKKRRDINIFREGRKNAEVARHALELVEISEIGFEAKIGSNDALRASMLMASTKIAYYSVVSALKSKQNCRINERFVPSLDHQTYRLDFYCILNISIADIIFSKVRHSIRMFYGKLDREVNHDS